MNYEEAIKELENIIAKLNDPKCPLVEATKDFERGVELSQQCYKELEQIKGKITIIKETLEGLTEEEE